MMAKGLLAMLLFSGFFIMISDAQFNPFGSFFDGMKRILIRTIDFARAGAQRKGIYDILSLHVINHLLSSLKLLFKKRLGLIFCDCILRSRLHVQLFRIYGWPK